MSLNDTGWLNDMWKKDKWPMDTIIQKLKTYKSIGRLLKKEPLRYIRLRLTKKHIYDKKR